MEGSVIAKKREEERHANANKNFRMMSNESSTKNNDLKKLSQSPCTLKSVKKEFKSARKTNSVLFDPFEISLQPALMIVP